MFQCLKPPLILKLYQKRFSFCECAIYKFTNIVRAKNYNELLQSVPLFTANNVYSDLFIMFVIFVWDSLYLLFHLPLISLKYEIDLIR